MASTFIFKTHIEEIPHIIALMSPWIVLAVLNNFLGVQFILSAGYNMVYRNAYAMWALIMLSLFAITIPRYAYHGLIASLTFCEGMLLLSFIYSIMRINQKINREEKFQE